MGYGVLGSRRKKGKVTGMLTCEGKFTLLRPRGVLKVH